jgi:hypothetical protein
MKDRNRRRDRLAVATAAWWLRNIGLPAEGFHYSRSAQRDERNGFAYTAAMEWRHAAEIFVANTLAAEYCWRQWERIMRLPRRLAAPVSTSSTFALALEPVAISPVVASLDPIDNHGLVVSHVF